MVASHYLLLASDSESSSLTRPDLARVLQKPTDATEASPCLIGPGFLAAELILRGDTHNMQSKPWMDMFMLLFCHLAQSWILLSIKTMTQKTWSHMQLSFSSTPSRAMGPASSMLHRLIRCPKTALRGRLQAALLCSLLGCSAGKRTVLKKCLGDMILLLVSDLDCPSQKNYVRVNTV